MQSARDSRCAVPVSSVFATGTSNINVDREGGGISFDGVGNGSDFSPAPAGSPEQTELQAQATLPHNVPGVGSCSFPSQRWAPAPSLSRANMFGQRYAHASGGLLPANSQGQQPLLAGGSNTVPPPMCSPARTSPPRVADSTTAFTGLLRSQNIDFPQATVGSLHCSGSMAVPKAARPTLVRGLPEWNSFGSPEVSQSFSPGDVTRPMPLATLPAAPSAAIPGHCYRADMSDAMDVAFSWALFAIQREFSKRLMVRRLRPGHYEIAGRRVSLHKGDNRSQGGQIFVREDDVADVAGSEIALGAYLSQAAHVAAALLGESRGTSTVIGIPVQKRLTFVTNGKGAEETSALDNVGEMERCKSMRLAVEQAQKRQAYAEVYTQMSVRAV